MAPDLASEALRIALRLREALETPGKRAALVTPSRGLGRRVAAELLRWGVRVDDSAGVPLDQSPPGSFLLLTALLAAPDAAPVDAAGGAEASAGRRRHRARASSARRSARWSGWCCAGRAARVGSRACRRRLAAGWTDAAGAPRLARHGIVGGSAAAGTARSLAGSLAAGRAAGGASGLRRVARRRRDRRSRRAVGARGRPRAPASSWPSSPRPRDAAGEVPTAAYPALLAVLMGGADGAAATSPAHPRLAILGQLEGRLVEADLVILGGLNEGSWPPAAESGPWLNRAMRASLGLPPAEQAIGIAAHDFLAVAGAPEVVLSRAAKDENGAPTVPSRWLARLQALLTATGDRGSASRPRDRRLGATARSARPAPPRPAARREPRPPLAARPRELWATDIERLMRDPYAVYARRILDAARRSSRSTPMPGGAERGQIIHAVLRGVRAPMAGRAARRPARASCSRSAREHFAPAGRTGRRSGRCGGRASSAIAAWFAEVEQRRRREVDAGRHRGPRARSTLDAPGGPFTLRARADRIEIGRDGRLGDRRLQDRHRCPAAARSPAACRPSSSIEALIAERGGFRTGRQAEAALLLFLQLKGGEPVAGDGAGSGRRRSATAPDRRGARPASRG